jgi:hypothetical protein
MPPIDRNAVLNVAVLTQYDGPIELVQRMQWATVRIYIEHPILYTFSVVKLCSLVGGYQYFGGYNASIFRVKLSQVGKREVICDEWRGT